MKYNNSGRIQTWIMSEQTARSTAKHLYTSFNMNENNKLDQMSRMEICTMLEKSVIDIINNQMKISKQHSKDKENMNMNDVDKQQMSNQSGNKPCMTTQQLQATSAGEMHIRAPTTAVFRQVKPWNRIQNDNNVCTVIDCML